MYSRNDWFIGSWDIGLDAPIALYKVNKFLNIRQAQNRESHNQRNFIIQVILKLLYFERKMDHNNCLGGSRAKMLNVMDRFQNTVCEILNFTHVLVRISFQPFGYQLKSESLFPSAESPLKIN